MPQLTPQWKPTSSFPPQHRHYDSRHYLRVLTIDLPLSCIDHYLCSHATYATQSNLIKIHIAHSFAHEFLHLQQLLILILHPSSDDKNTKHSQCSMVTLLSHHTACCGTTAIVVVLLGVFLLIPKQNYVCQFNIVIELSSVPRDCQ